MVRSSAKNHGFVTIAATSNAQQYADIEAEMRACITAAAPHWRCAGNWHWRPTPARRNMTARFRAGWPPASPDCDGGLLLHRHPCHGDACPRMRLFAAFPSWALPVNPISATVRVKNRLGLHARPAMSVVDAASGFASDIFLVKDGQRVDAKSIMHLMMLAAAPRNRNADRSGGRGMPRRRWPPWARCLTPGLARTNHVGRPSTRPRRKRPHTALTRKRRMAGMLPTLLTLGNLVSGFAAIIAATKDPAKSGLSLPFHWTPLHAACWCIFIGRVCDGLDGTAARLTRHHEPHGGRNWIHWPIS